MPRGRPQVDSSSLDPGTRTTEAEPDSGLQLVLSVHLLFWRVSDGSRKWNHFIRRPRHNKVILIISEIYCKPQTNFLFTPWCTWWITAKASCFTIKVLFWASVSVVFVSCFLRVVARCESFYWATTEVWHGHFNLLYLEMSGFQNKPLFTFQIKTSFKLRFHVQKLQLN